MFVKTISDLSQTLKSIVKFSNAQSVTFCLIETITLTDTRNTARVKLEKPLLGMSTKPPYMFERLEEK